MSKVMLLMFLSFLTQLFSATYTVDGYAYLEGKTDHSGIKVFFQRVAPDASFSYTVYTNSAGYYSQIVENGWYNIEFTKTGYDKITLTNIALYSTQTIGIQTLIAQGLAGSIDGILHAGVYNVTDTLTVLGGDSLIIEPGVVMNFNTNAVFQINGYLKAEGTKSDSIIFRPTLTDWKGININNSIYSSMSYCSIKKTKDRAISISGGSETRISYSEINTLKNGIGVGGTECILNSVKIIGNNTGDGIFMQAGLNIENCIITGFNTGIYVIAGNVLVDNSLIVSVEHNIFFQGGEFLKLYNSSLITDNDSIELWGGVATIFNCNIVNKSNVNHTGICFSMEEEKVVLNTNVYGFVTTYYNCGPYLGVIVTTNANGDPCDAYGNISMNPKFVNVTNGNYSLQADSPCIDAGTNSISGYTFPERDLAGNFRIWDGDDSGTSLVDIGAYEYGSLEIINSPTNINISVIANTLTLTWDAIPFADSYLIYGSNVPYGTFELLNSVSSNSWNTVIGTNTKKFYYVVANSNSVK